MNLFKASIAILLISSNAVALTLTATLQSSGVFTGLQTTPLIRASDAMPTIITQQWRQDTPFAIADETVVCAFLRHFGWFLCWEHARELRDVVLPAIPSGKLFFTGIGSSLAVQEFASNLDIDPALCFADEGGEAGDVLGLGKGFKTMWNPSAIDTMMGRNDEESLKALGESYKSAIDNVGFQKLAPPNMMDTFRQGGTFVFKGNNLLLEHYDEKVGDNCSIDDILKVL
jgi:hypothetical protein